MPEVNPVGVESFADKMLSLLPATPFWLAPTAPEIQVNQLADPENPAIAVGSGGGSFSGAIARALRAVNPLNPLGSVQANLAQASGQVGVSASNTLKEGAKAVKAAGGSITSGLKWATFLIVVGAGLYLFLLAAPFIPKPSGAR